MSDDDVIASLEDELKAINEAEENSADDTPSVGEDADKKTATDVVDDDKGTDDRADAVDDDTGSAAESDDKPADAEPVTPPAAEHTVPVHVLTDLRKERDAVRAERDDTARQLQELREQVEAKETAVDIPEVKPYSEDEAKKLRDLHGEDAERLIAERTALAASTQANLALHKQMQVLVKKQQDQDAQLKASAEEQATVADMAETPELLSWYMGNKRGDEAAAAKIKHAQAYVAVAEIRFPDDIPAQNAFIERSVKTDLGELATPPPKDETTKVDKPAVKAKTDDASPPVESLSDIPGGERVAPGDSDEEFLSRFLAADLSSITPEMEKKANEIMQRM